jgi:hypothetical protein
VDCAEAILSEPAIDAFPQTIEFWEWPGDAGDAVTNGQAVYDDSARPGIVA